MKIPNPPRSRSQSSNNHDHNTGEVPFEAQKAAADKAKELPPIDEKAFYGIIGRVALKVGDHTEADPRGVLPALLVSLGNVLGRDVYSRVGDTYHFCNEFICLVGQTGAARKGTATDIVETITGYVDGQWKQSCVARSLSSGEGLITLVCDEVVKSKRKKGDDGTYVFEQEVVREGVTDKRKLCILPELGGLLTIMSREGNSLSHGLRDAWDSRKTMEINTKNSSVRATDAHISLIGNITRGELLKLIAAIPNSDGFANRFLWFLVHRIKSFSEGGDPSEKYLPNEITEIREAVRFARALGQMTRSEKARKYWKDLYDAIGDASNGDRDVVERAEAHMLRISNMYAATNKSPRVEVEHLMAAEALWRYSEACTLQIFGTEELCREAQFIRDFLEAPGNEGATRTLIQNRLFHNNKTGAEITTWLRTLHDKGLIRYTTERIENGNLVEHWFPCRGMK